MTERRDSASQQHHNVSKFYLAGFTEGGTTDSQFHVLEPRSGRSWFSTPAKSARERNLNRIEADGLDPLVLEKSLSTLETSAASVILDVSSSLRPPTGNALASLVLFAAYMSEMTKPRRELWDGEEDRGVRWMLEMSAAPPGRFETMKNAVEEKNGIKSNLTYEKYVEYLDRSHARFSNTHRATRLMALVDAVYRMLMARRWSIVVPAEGAGHFICSDVPAVVYEAGPWSSSPGLMSKRSEFTMPLNRGLILLGRFEGQSGWATAAARDVAALNNRTRMHAKLLYCPHEHFPWIRRDGCVSTSRAELIAESAPNP